MISQRRKTRTTSRSATYQWSSDCWTRYLFRDAHERWFILQPSAKESVDDFVRWVYLPEGKPAEVARTAIR